MGLHKHVGLQWGLSVSDWSPIRQGISVSDASPIIIIFVDFSIIYWWYPGHGLPLTYKKVNLYGSAVVLTEKGIIYTLTPLHNIYTNKTNIYRYI